MPSKLVEALDRLAKKNGQRPAHEILNDHREKRYWWAKERS